VTKSDENEKIAQSHKIFGTTAAIFILKDIFFGVSANLIEAK
jgi:hypothetical protein